MTRLSLKTKPRRPKHAMNKLEQRYADILERQFQQGTIKGFGFQRYTFRLADDTRFTPDFHVVTLDDVLEFHETKGFMRDDAHVKLKVAAEMFPHPFKLVKYDKTNGWVVKDV